MLQSVNKQVYYLLSFSSAFPIITYGGVLLTPINHILILLKCVKYTKAKGHTIKRRV